MVKENQLLKELYAAKYDACYRAIKNYNDEIWAEMQAGDNSREKERATNPLLIQIDESYLNSDIRVMLFGQETNGWLNYIKDREGEFAQDPNTAYYLYNDYYNWFQKGIGNSNTSPFWQGFIRLKDHISKGKAGMVWNNISKIGKIEAGHNGDIYQIGLEKFNVIKEEIDILKPDVLVFFSGPYYDGEIKNVLGGFGQEGIKNDVEPRELAKLSFDDIDVKLALRTYHPGYLWRSKKREYVDFIAEQIDRL